MFESNKLCFDALTDKTEIKIQKISKYVPSKKQAELVIGK